MAVRPTTNRQENFMEIPGLGKFTRDSEFGWYYSDPVTVPMLNGKQCRLVLEGYDEDPAREEIHDAIENFLSATSSVLKDAETYIFQYYQDMNSYFSPSDDEFLPIEHPGGVWEHIQLGNEPMVCRRAYGDHGIYISLECNCDWEREHGLQIVFKDGAKVTKVGPYDGHLTNSDAYADPGLEHVVYR